ncbi:MAG TPA: hypothetical protein VGF86_04600 [Candidatus Tumulicola sp.]|jgi:hypothetical protein
MRVPAFSSQLLSAAAAAVFLASCGGGSSQPNASGFAPAAPQVRHATGYRPMVSAGGVMSVLPAGFKPNLHRPAWMKSAPDAGKVKPGLAVAQFGGDSVLWFLKSNHKNKPPRVCEPASSTNGIRVDSAGDLWIPDGRADTTTEYAPNCGAAKLTIPDPTGEPADVALDRAGNVYILNINNTSGAPTVNAYKPTGKPIRTLSDPSFAVLFGVGTDRNGNVFVSNLTTSNVGNVVEFPKGKMPGTQLSGVSLGLPGTPAFDSHGNLIISDWFNGTIDVFAPPYTGAPTTSTLMGASIWCPLSRSEKRLYCGDAENGSIDVYAYPGGAYLYSYTASLSPSALVTGVSPFPALPY